VSWLTRVIGVWRATINECVIESSGYHPQAGEAFSYKDQKREFWFYVEFVASPDNERDYTLIINDASTGRFAGVLPQVDAEGRAEIERNIRSHFGRFGIMGNPVSPSNPAPVVIFTWALGS
jgi:hypothetical protein